MSGTVALALAGVAFAAGLLAVVPALLTDMGGIELAAWARGAWDPTWNDGDLGICAAGFAALLVLVAGAAASGGAVARRGGVAVGAGVAASGIGAVAVATIGAWALAALTLHWAG